MTSIAGAQASGGTPGAGGTPAAGGITGVTLVGGVAAIGGQANTGGVSTEPVTTVVGPPAVDVLFMIDNSASMADKQHLLAASVPQLIERLAQPNCLDTTGAVVGKSQLGVCAVGTPEFNSVNNLHIGVITSSLGDHGSGQLCLPGAPTSFTDSTGNIIVQPVDVNDQAHLIGTSTRGTSKLMGDTAIVQSASVKLDPQGFLAWGSSAQTTTADLTSAELAFADMVSAVGESGCGFESQLESWFRFLIDPVPPILPVQKNDMQQAQRAGSDDVLLAQRAAFLRPNSTLAIVMLTDENDCSLRDTDVGWVAAALKYSIATGSVQCQTNPNDKCCYSCTTNGPLECESGCPNGTAPGVHDSAFQGNLRCWQQKRRFGYEFMYPVSRYVVGLTKPRLCPDQTFGDMDCDCTYAKSIGASCNPGSRNLPNPLFSTVIGTDNSGNSVLAAAQVKPRADTSSIFLMGILGVPWQDVGYVDSSGNLAYIPVTDAAWTSGTNASAAPVTPAPHGIWSNIFGDDNANVVPEDVHMVESLVPRQGLPGPTADANADPISGHEWDTALTDLQYACVFPLPLPRACTCATSDVNYASCKYTQPNDCCDLTYNVDGEGNAGGGEFHKPLCNGRTQVAAKAYPALREIAVLRGYAQSPNAVQNHSIVTSICPKDLSGDKASPGYGYNPAINALVARMKETGFK
jgi:hypothetical protein